MKNQTPLVSICCTAFNHENFIRDAIEGFLMQETGFPFEIIIHDDASTDNTAKIIKEYEAKHPGLFVTIYQTENQYSRGIKIYSDIVLPRVRGKYMAFCEGDDYWTDPLKLQKQLDFLEGIEECVVCGTRFLEEKVQNGKKIYKKGRGQSDNRMFYYKDILHGWISYRTCSLMVRKNAIGNIEKPEGVLFGDKLLLMNVLKQGGFGVILPDFTCVYRIHAGGVWSGARKTENLLSYFNLFHSYKNIIPKIYHKDARKLLSDFSLRLLINHIKEGEWAQAGKYIRFLKINYSSFRIVYDVILGVLSEIFKKNKMKKPKVITEIGCNQKG